MSEASGAIGELYARADNAAQNATAFSNAVITSLRDLANIRVMFPIYSGNAYDDDGASAVLESLRTGHPEQASSQRAGTAFAEAAPSAISLSTIDTSQIEAYHVTPPLLDIPPTPEVTLPSAPLPPSLQSISIPDPPLVTLPALPHLADVAIPVFGGMSLPTFTALPPAPQIADPVNPLPWNEAAYAPPAIQEAMTWAVGVLVNGGTLVAPADEARLLGRAKDEAVAAVQNAGGSIARSFRSRGFLLPVGAELAAQRRLARETAGVVSIASREWAVKLLDIAREARGVALDKAVQYAGVVLPYQAGIAERLLTMNKYLAEWGIAKHNAAVEQAKLAWQGYETNASVFKTLVMAETERVNAYKAELEASRIRGEVNESHVRIYTAQVEAAKAMMGLYESRVRGAEAQAKIQELVLAQFREQISGYTATVNAEVARFNLYAEQLKAEELKVGIYGKQVDAAKTVADVNRGRAEAQLTAQKNQIDAYRARVDAWVQKGNTHHANLDAAIKQTRLSLDEQGMNNDLWKSRLAGWESYARLMQTKSDAIARHNEVKSAQGIQETEIQLRQLVASITHTASVQSDMAKAYMSLIGSSLAGVNAVVSAATSA